jgi:hypothetical protein
MGFPVPLVTLTPLKGGRKITLPGCPQGIRRD